MIRDDITGRPLVVSNKSTQTIILALTAAHRMDLLTDEQYCMTYAEVCEPGYLPQAFGGGAVAEEEMQDWINRKSWQ